MKTKITFIIVFTLFVVLTLMTSSCAGSKYGCPGATSQGRVPGKFNK